MELKVRGRSTYTYTASRAPDAARPWALFLHGAGMDHTVWLLQSRYFAHHGWNVLVPDLPGHGRSTGEPLATIAGIGDWVADLLDAAGAPRVVAAGHSMGALVALDLALRHPARVDRLALLGASVPMPVSDALLGASAANEHAALEMINTWGHGPRAHIGGNPVPGMWMSGQGIRLLERAAPGVVHRDLAACNSYRPDDGQLAAIACPVTVLAGRQDRMTPARAVDALVRRLSGAVVQHLDCGHMMMTEAPDAVLDALVDAWGSQA